MCVSFTALHTVRLEYASLVEHDYPIYALGRHSIQPRYMGLVHKVLAERALSFLGSIGDAMSTSSPNCFDIRDKYYNQ